MSGTKRPPLFQGGKDGFNPNWEQDVQLGDADKPQRASAAQLAQRKIASLKHKRARPTGGLSSSAPAAPASNPFASLPSFNFGGADKSATNGTSAPAFGGFGAPTSGPENSSAPIFSFSTSQANTSDSSNPPAPAFSFSSSFGGAQNNVPPATTTTTTTTTSSSTLFSFGSGTQPASNNPSPTPSFSFGGAVQNPGTTDNTSKPFFAFGAPPTTSAPENISVGSPSAAPPFSFSASSPAPSEGNLDDLNKAPQSSSLFTFGSSVKKPSSLGSAASRSRSASPAKGFPEKKPLFTNQSFPSATPPASTTGGFSFFGQQNPEEKPAFVNFFGANTSSPAASSAEPSTTTSAPVNNITKMTGQSSFSAFAAPSSTPQAQNSLFPTSGSSLFKPGGDMANANAKTTADAAPSTGTLTSTAQATNSLFGFTPKKPTEGSAEGIKPEASASVSPPAAAPAAPAPLFAAPGANLFGSKPTPTAGNSQPAFPAKSDTNIFGALNKSNGSSTSGPLSTSTPSKTNTNPFGVLGKPTNGVPAFGSPSVTADASAVKPSGNIFGTPTKPANDTSSMGPSANAAEPPAAKSSANVFAGSNNPNGAPLSGPPSGSIPKLNQTPQPNKDFTASPADKATPKFAPPPVSRIPELPDVTEENAAAREAELVKIMRDYLVPDPPEYIVSLIEREAFVKVFRVHRLNLAIKEYLARQNDCRDWTPVMKHYIDCMKAIMDGTPEPARFVVKRKATDEPESTPNVAKKMRAEDTSVRPPSAKRRADQLEDGPEESNKRSKPAEEVSYPKLNPGGSATPSSVRPPSPTKRDKIEKTPVSTNKPDATPNTSSQTANLFGNLLKKSSPEHKPAGNIFSPTPTTQQSNLFSPSTPSQPAQTQAPALGSFLSASGGATPGFAFSAGGSGASTPFGALSRAGTVSPAPSTTGGQSVFDSEEHRRTPDHTNNFFAKFAEDKSTEPDDEEDEEEETEAEEEGSLENGKSKMRSKAETSGRKDGLFGRISFPGDQGSHDSQATSRGTSASTTSAADTSFDDSGAPSGEGESGAD